MNNRREFLKIVAVASGAGAVLAACHSSPKALDCTDVSALSDADKAMRTTLKYEDKSPDPTKVCAGCNFFQKPASADACGACTLVKGPINPGGKCSSWIAKQG